MEVPGAQIYVPRNRVAGEHGGPIIKAGDSWGDEPSSVGGGDSSGRDLEDSLRPDVRARLEGRALLRHL